MKMPRIVCETVKHKDGINNNSIKITHFHTKSEISIEPKPLGFINQLHKLASGHPLTVLILSHSKNQYHGSSVN